MGNLRRVSTRRGRNQREHKQGTETRASFQEISLHQSWEQAERKQEQSASSLRYACEDPLQGEMTVQGKGRRANQGRRSRNITVTKETVGLGRGQRASRGRRSSSDTVTEKAVGIGRGQRASRGRRSCKNSAVSEETAGRGRGQRASRGRKRSRDTVTEETVGRGRGQRASRGRKSSRDTVTEETAGRGRGQRASRGRKSSGDTVTEKKTTQTCGRGRKKNISGQQESSRGRKTVPSRPRRKGTGIVKSGYSDEDMTRVAVLQQRRSQALNVRSQSAILIQTKLYIYKTIWQPTNTPNSPLLYKYNDIINCVAGRGFKYVFAFKSRIQ